MALSDPFSLLSISPQAVPLFFALSLFSFWSGDGRREKEGRREFFSVIVFAAVVGFVVVLVVVVLVDACCCCCRCQNVMAHIIMVTLVVFFLVR